MYSVGYLIGTSPLAEAGLEPLARETSSPFFAYRVTEAVPGAYLANPIAVAASETEALARILEPGFRPGRDVVVDRLPEAWKLESRSHAPGEASFLAYETDRVRVTVHARKPAILVLNDSFHPGWQATVDGKPVEILRANGFVRGVPVETGTHEVEFVYRPAGLRRGLPLSVLGLAIAVSFVRRGRGERCH